MNGLLTAAVLAVVGYGYAELAGLFLASKSPGRGPQAVQPDALADSLHERMPMMMAFWGFAFIAVGEIVLHLIRTRRKPLPPAEVKADEATVLLEQILSKVESERATLADASHTTSPATAENSPVAS